MIRATLAALALGCSFTTLAVAAEKEEKDPYLWLEEIEGKKALDWVKAENAATDKLILGRPGFEADRKRARTILDDDRQIAMPGEVMGDTITNFWRDAANPRGLWRQSPLAAYLAGKPEWKVLIDVDALGKAEKQSWVWHGADCLAPDYKRCLVSLSPGGTDADIVREWDRGTGTFVEGGFTVPLAKSSVTWEDADNLLVATDFGEGSMTTSGYPRIVKRWKRGTPLSAAETLVEGETADVGMGVGAEMDGDTRWPMISRNKSFYTTDFYLRRPGNDGDYNRTIIPETAELRAVIDGQAIVFLNDPSGSSPAGSLLAMPLLEMARGDMVPIIEVMTPSASQAIENVAAGDDVLWVKALDDVEGKLFALRRDQPYGRWSQKAVPLAANATVQIAGVVGKTNQLLATAETMLQPPTLYALGESGAPQTVQSLPAVFDAKDMSVEKRFATSKDGTKIPYFLARKKGTTGPVPALVHAYGGFKAAQTPGYLTGQPYRAGPLGLFWVEDGNAYVLANIRGGGEYGPAWHQAALYEKRQNSFDDLHAVAEDLVATGVSPKGKIAISGRSNGGVLVGAAMEQRPDLYGAVISGSPLKDMKRFNKLLAGASWVDEYGDPDDPADWAFISKYSPYQNLKKGVKYPPIFLYLSTKDDRVHPGHARKFAARLKEYRNSVYYHEYLEGGHSVGADHAEDAVRAAMLHAFLLRELVEKK
ncbi:MULTISPECIES: prolyl oligopeptidase family serine peptidase [unclassified Sphingopyxis]|uniref:prolyl oligopeptidase family serine peptidase n=1 Tax=unclassified Sphingopyxis TaxID=2614943 RepID=UPI000735EADD|nr:MULTISPECIES: prolyl oligopeptidase family serine peptidase [unclassified Sphingopyxis]KTE42352.1 peptidase S9 [Sphingopyxis sp. HIX]KTE85360.1 peptidase S9 [Sphingopyxis sp. HXXIV]